MSSNETAAPSPLHVIHVEIDNVLRVRNADVDIPEGVAVLSGQNAQGKSSFLNAIEMALLGRRAESDVPIHDGHAAGHVQVILGCNGEPRFTVERTFKRGSASKLVVKTADGSPRASPQDMLDELIGLRSWNPLEFASPPGEKTSAGVAKRQREMLLRAVPLSLDLDKWEARKVATYDDRKEANKEVKRLEGVIATMPVIGVVDDDEDGLAERKAYDVAQAENAKVAQARSLEKAGAEAVSLAERAVREADAGLDAARRRLEQAQRDVALSEKALESSQAELAEATAKLTVIRQSVAAVPTPLEPLWNAIEAVTARNRDRALKREAASRRKASLALLREVESVARDFDRALSELDEEKSAALSAAKFPVPGLGIDEAGVTYNGRPFNQASSAESIEVSLAIGAALAGRLRCMFLRDGDKLDRTTLARISEWAAREGHQLIIERVAEDIVGAFVFEDGQIVGTVKAAATSSPSSLFGDAS